VTSHREIDISLILPAFNESATIRGTIEEAIAYFSERGLRYEIIVAADGSDGTREIVAQMAVKNPALQVMGDPERLGKGRGVRLAVAKASGTIIGYADADNKVPIRELDTIMPWFSEGFDIVIGSRGLPHSTILRKQPLYRRVGSWGFGKAMRILTGVYDVIDTQCGFKFFRKDVAKDIFRHQSIDGYMFDVEIIALALRRGYPLTEVPIVWKDDGDSRLQLVAGNIRIVFDLFRIRALLHSLDAAPKPAAVKRAAAD
jgi:dolichyl-phosphate beta-glucosyltransferase